MKGNKNWDKQKLVAKATGEIIKKWKLSQGRQEYLSMAHSDFIWKPKQNTVALEAKRTAF